MRLFDDTGASSTDLLTRDARFLFDALPGLELPGKLQRVAAIGTENFETRGATYMAYITLDRQDSRLRWNMSATVTTAPPAGNASGASPSTISAAFEPGR